MENQRLLLRPVCEPVALRFVFSRCFTFGTATIANLTLSVCIIIPAFCFWFVLIFCKVTPEVFQKISFINKVELRGYGCFDFRDEWVYKYIDVFKQFDHREIAIGTTSPESERGAILYRAVLAGMALSDGYPTVYDHLLPDDKWGITEAYTVYHNLLDERGVLLANQDDSMTEKLTFGRTLFYCIGHIRESRMIGKLSFGRHLAWATVYAGLLLCALFSILSAARKRVVFYREKQTVAIPPGRNNVQNSGFQSGKSKPSPFLPGGSSIKKQPIPLQKAVISFGQDDLRGVDGVVIADYPHRVGEVSLQFAGRRNGYCFARFIQSYRTDDDLSDYPEFEAFRQIQEEIRREKAYSASKSKKEVK